MVFQLWKHSSIKNVGWCRCIENGPPFPAPFRTPFRRFSCGNKVDWSGCSRNTMDRIRILRKMKLKACCRLLQWSEANMLYKFETFLERSGKIRHKAQKKRGVSSRIGGKWVIIKSWSLYIYIYYNMIYSMCLASLPSWLLWKQTRSPENIFNVSASFILKAHSAQTWFSCLWRQ